MLINDKNAIMLRINHYKTRKLLLMIRKALKLDRSKVSTSLGIRVNTLYNIETRPSMRTPIPKTILQGLCSLYCIDFETIYEKMNKEHEDFLRICLL
ncbi:hypothetical protein UFOVP844_15 [uncultured Caudovirales phage]|uniref:Uncharacterized protein n=1 Tax=uncultured Caudovirales phage TaxID=2100421 RepID=A0A6J5P552_9CAUD|nr:hypothetical protein UFOVP844_15 [uncultured Caudovirales phage]